jgi:hypothetical protein
MPRLQEQRVQNTGQELAPGSAASYGGRSVGISSATERGKENRIMLTALKRGEPLRTAEGSAMVLYPISRNTRSELPQGSNPLLFVTLFYCFPFVKKKAPWWHHTVTASLEVMALCLDGITNTGVYLYVQSATPPAAPAPPASGPCAGSQPSARAPGPVASPTAGPAAAPDTPARRRSAGATLHRFCSMASQFPHHFRRIMVE